MKFSVIGSGALLVEDGSTGPWLFGAPTDIKDTLNSNGLEVPDVLFTTGYKSPGLGRLGKPVIRYKSEPLNLEDMRALPIKTPGGTDYEIESADGTILFSQRPNLTPQETLGYDLVVSCKESDDQFGEHVLFLGSLEETAVLEGAIVNGSLHFVEKESTKPTDSSEDKKEDEKDPVVDIDSGEDDDVLELEEKEIQGKKPVQRIGDMLVADLHTAYKDLSDRLLREGYLDETERMSIGTAIGDGLRSFKENLPSEVDQRVYVDPHTTVAIKEALKELELDIELPDTVDGQWCGVYKDSEGRDRWVAISSVAEWDRHNELFTVEAMDWAIRFNELLGREIHGGTLGPLRYRHTPGCDGGYCDTQLRAGDFLFETGGFYDNPVGDSMKKKLKEESGIWGISLGLLYRPTDIINGEYQRAIPFERSMTPKPANVMAVMSIANKESDDD